MEETKFGLVTTTSSGPTKFDRGTLQVSVVEFVKSTFEQFSPSATVTVVPDRKFPPVSVILVDRDPDVGKIEVRDGPLTTVIEMTDDVDPPELVPVTV